MTVQINDTVFHRKIDFYIAGSSGSGLFNTATLGFRPVATSTACWRGYVAEYSVIDGALFLTSLDIGLPEDAAVLAKSGKGPELFGVLPQPGAFTGFHYEGFRVPMLFSGGLLLTAGFIYEPYHRIEFRAAWQYEQVREIICDAGRITEDHDRSNEMADVRLKLVEDTTRTQGFSPKNLLDEIEACVKKSFSHDY